MRGKGFNNKILIMLSAIFFFTSVAVEVNNVKSALKATQKRIIEKKEIKQISNIEYSKQDNQQSYVDSKASHTLELLNVLGKAVNYLEASINKGDIDNLGSLIKDSTSALNSVDKVLRLEDTSELEIKIISLKSGFEDLDIAVKDKDLNKSKEIINNRILKDYEIIIKFFNISNNYQK